MRDGCLLASSAVMPLMSLSSFSMRLSVRATSCSVGRLNVVSASLSSASLGLLVGPKGRHASKRPGEQDDLDLYCSGLCSQQ